MPRIHRASACRRRVARRVLRKGPPAGDDLAGFRPRFFLNPRSSAVAQLSVTDSEPSEADAQAPQVTTQAPSADAQAPPAAAQAPSAAPSHCLPLQSFPKIIPSSELLQGRREVWIEHGSEMYRLRLTTSGKLYLTK
ncbi:hemin uptake protein HemP [Novipirellula caenicola]|uniref:Hemin uptake protein hemP n=1 Tax=Novipirellula caenicola TaxID=1536901 RepID=A0ABP9VTH7_9BACT